MRISYKLICPIACILIPPLAYAGAWTENQGNSLLIVTGSYYSSDHYWNDNGSNKSQSNYSEYDLNPYFEYGLRDDITIGTSLSLEQLDQKTSANAGNNNWGVGDSEFFLRKRLWNQSGFVISAEPIIKLPSPESPALSPRIGTSTPDAGFGLSAGYGFSAYGLNHFVDLDTQYRHRFGAPHDQVITSSTLGISLTPRWMIMPQTFVTLRTASNEESTFTQSDSDDYNLVRLQLSAVYKVSDTWSLQAGGFSDIYGKNVGQGNGALLALWKSM